MRIFISTNNGKYDTPLRGLFSGGDFSAIWELPIYNSLIFPSQCEVLYYNSHNNSFQNAAVDTDIVILRDTLTALPNDIQIEEDDYLLHHELENYHLNFIKPLFGQKTIEGHHIANNSNKYLPVFKVIFENENDKVNRILDVLGFRGEKLKLEAYIRLHKSLKLLPLKGNWKESSLEDAKKTFKDLDNINLVEDKLANISFKKNIDEYYQQLESIEAEIIKLSTTK